MINIPTADVNNTEAKIDIKLARLIDLMKEYIRGGVIITFSGGVDSAFLVWVAHKALQDNPAGKVFALTTNSASMPMHDKEDAERFTKQFGIEHIWCESKEMENPAYINNDEQRCYHCKNELFSIAKEEAVRLDLKWIMYGYNASDINDVRPGHKAALENSVLYPLAEIGFSKDEIRTILKNEQIEIAEKAASPCLSSRISHGISVTSGKLADIAAMENILHMQGIKICRVRINGTGDDLFLRIEVHPDEINKIIDIKDILNSEGRKRGYKWVTLDLSGYRMGGGTE